MENKLWLTRKKPALWQTAAKFSDCSSRIWPASKSVFFQFLNRSLPPVTADRCLCRDSRELEIPKKNLSKRRDYLHTRETLTLTLTLKHRRSLTLILTNRMVCVSRCTILRGIPAWETLNSAAKHSIFRDIRRCLLKQSLTQRKKTWNVLSNACLPKFRQRRYAVTKARNIQKPIQFCAQNLSNYTARSSNLVNFRVQT